MDDHQLRHKHRSTDVSQLRGGMIGQVQKSTSKRFSAEPSVDEPSMWITDHVTGRQCQVGLFAARETLEALNELFPDEDTS